MDFVDSFFNNYNGSAAPTTGYTGQVYLGEEKVKGFEEVSPTGATYKVPARTKEVTESIATAKNRYLTDEKLRAKWATALRKNGIEANPIQARAIWELSVDGASDWYATSAGKQKITPEKYLEWYAGGQKKKPAIPTRQIYDITPEQIDADIEKIVVDKLGRTLQDEDRNADWYQDLIKGVQKLYSKGVVSQPAEIVTNKKTGQQERISRQTPEFSKEKVEQRITKAVEKADPEALARKERVDFTQWLFSQMGGQG